jgi:riboflavin kinase/FMN adenylyltransferase
MQQPLFTFTARIVPGSHRGKGMGTPTLNLDLANVPEYVMDGIYVCRVMIDGESLDAVMHKGPRPVHKDTPSCEVHVLDRMIETPPEAVQVEVIDYLRPVLDFPSEAALIAQIADDIANARGILQTYGDASSETADS